MALIFTFLENTGKQKFVKYIILDIIKTITIMLLVAVAELLLIKGICYFTGMTGDRTQDINSIINNLKYIFNNFMRVIINTGGMLNDGSFITLLTIVSVLATILFIMYSEKTVENLVELILIIVVALASSFIASAMSLSGFNSARIRFTIGALIGVLFVLMYCKSKLFEKVEAPEIIFSFLVIAYMIINVYTYFSITTQHKITNEFEKIEAERIVTEIEEYENENNIVVDTICIIKKNDNNYKLESSKNSCVLTCIATRCEWGVKGAIQYYEGRKLEQVDSNYINKKEFELSEKQYDCIGDTLYINVSMY